MELNFMKEAKLNPCPPSNTKTGEGDSFLFLSIAANTLVYNYSWRVTISSWVSRLARRLEGVASVWAEGLLHISLSTH
jgi:hypothetical protein